MTETNWGLWILATALRVLILLFILWLLYEGLRRLTLWRSPGVASHNAYKVATEQYIATKQIRYICQTCGVAREGRFFYFDVTGPDGHQIEQCMACTRRRAEANTASIQESA